jgi:glutamine amidotransferase
MSVAIIDCGSGNLRSAAKAFEKMATKTTGPVYVTKCPDVVAKADFIVLPGQGAFPNVKKGLDSIPGLRESLKEQVVDCGKPFLGICVGMQLMADVSHEYVPTDGLGWVPGEVSNIDPNRDLKKEDKPLKVPHMGWNAVTIYDSGHPVLNNIDNGSYFYFVHSFQLTVEKKNHLIATTDYGIMITAVVGRDNMIGTQFHPEKSQGMGLRLIQNFLAWCP